MNKNTFYLLITLGALITVLSIKFYKTQKTEALSEYVSLVKFEKKLKEINYLKHSLSNPSKLKLKSCEIQNRTQKMVITCNDLDKQALHRVQNSLFKRNYDINRYTIIENNGKVSIKAEILK